MSSVDSATAPAEDAERRRDLTAQLERIQDIYVMGNMTRAQYLMHRQAIEQELERMAPPVDPQLVKAAATLADFGTFWEMESSPAERRKRLTSLFERVWEQNGAITAVKPRVVFAGYFRGMQSHTRHRATAVPKAGATGSTPRSAPPHRDPGSESRPHLYCGVAKRWHVSDTVAR